MKLARCRGRRSDGYRCRQFGPGDSATFWLCGRHESQDGDPEGWRLPLTLGPLAVQFIEELCVHGPGDVQGEAVTLTDEEVKFLYELYELDPSADSAQLARYLAVLCRAKGFRKTEMLGWIGCFEMMGPCRPDSDDEGKLLLDADGDAVGKPVQAARVGSVATEEGQAGESFAVGSYVINESLGEYFPVEVLADEIRMKDGSGGEWSVMTSTARSKDGAKTTALLLDEPHLWVTPGLHRLYQMVMRQLVKRQSGGLAIAATTAWRPGQRSVAEAAYKTFLQDPGGGVLFDMRSAPDGIDVSDQKQVMAGLKYAYGDATWVPVDRIWSTEFKTIGVDPMKTESDARRYYLNQPKAPENRFIPNMTVWEDLADKVEVPDRARIAVGFDGSKTGDSTQLVGCWFGRDDGAPPYVFELGSWERPTELEWDEPWEVDRQEVEDQMSALEDRYNIVVAVVDPAFWPSTVARWGKTLNVVEFNFNSPAQTGRAFRLLLDGIKDGGLRHDGSDVLARHLSNAVRSERGAKGRNGEGHLSIRKEDEHSREWIDAAVAATLAFWGVQYAENAGLVGERQFDQVIWS